MVGSDNDESSVPRDQAEQQATGGDSMVEDESIPTPTVTTSIPISTRTTSKEAEIEKWTPTECKRLESALITNAQSKPLYLSVYANHGKGSVFDVASYIEGAFTQEDLSTLNANLLGKHCTKIGVVRSNHTANIRFSRCQNLWVYMVDCPPIKERDLPPSADNLIPVVQVIKTTISSMHPEAGVVVAENSTPVLESQARRVSSTTQKRRRSSSPQEDPGQASTNPQSTVRSEASTRQLGGDMAGKVVSNPLPHESERQEFYDDQIAQMEKQHTHAMTVLAAYAGALESENCKYREAMALVVDLRLEIERLNTESIASIDLAVLEENRKYRVAMALVVDLRLEIERLNTESAASRVLAMQVAKSKPKARKAIFQNLLKEIKDSPAVTSTGRMYVAELRAAVVSVTAEPVDDSGRTVAERVETGGTSHELVVAQKYYSEITMPDLDSKMRTAMMHQTRMAAAEEMAVRLPEGLNRHPLVNQFGEFREFDYAADLAMKESGKTKPLYDLLFSLITTDAWRKLNYSIQKKICRVPFVPFKPAGGAGSRDTWTKDKLENYLESRVKKKRAMCAVLIDVIVYMANAGQQIISMLLMRIAVAVSAGGGIVESSHALLTAVGLMPHHDTVERVVDVAADTYLAAFPIIYMMLLAQMEMLGTAIVLIILVDNFVVRVAKFAKVLKHGSNTKTTATEQGLIMRPHTVNLKKPSERCSCVCPPFDGNRLRLFWEDKSEVIFLSIPEGGSNAFVVPSQGWVDSAISMPRDTNPAPLRLFHAVPSIEACSASYSDYKDKFVKRHFDLCGIHWNNMHPVFCHDIEFWFHFFKLLIEAPDLVRNVLLMPNELHCEKHVMESTLRCKEHLFFLYVPLWTKELQYAKKKWSEVGAKLKATFIAREKEAAAAAALLESNGDGSNEASAVESVALADAANEALLDAVDEIEAQAVALDAPIGVDAPSATPRVVGSDPLCITLEEIPPVAVLIDGLEQASQWDDGAEDEDCISDDSRGDGALHDDVLVEAHDEVEEETGPAEASELTEFLVPMIFKVKNDAQKLKHAERRAQCVAHKLATPEQALTLKSQECLDLLILGLKLKTATELAGPKTEEEKATVNLSKGIGTNNRLSAVWWPEGMGLDDSVGRPGGVRGAVIALARTELCDGNEDYTDDQVIGKAIDASSFFTGMWMLLEVEIGLLTRAMAQWTRGNIRPYLNAFPYLAQIVGSTQKPKVARAMLYKLERLVLYNEKHPDVLTFFSENCLRLRETRIEDWHSVLTHYVNKHVADVQPKNYERASCMGQQVRKLKGGLNEVLFNQKPRAAERLGLLDKLQSKATLETNDSVAELLLKPFREMIAQIKAHGKCEGPYADEMWPRSTRLPKGQSKLVTALELTEAFHAQWARESTEQPVPEGLLDWLNHSSSTLLKIHNPELIRRELPRTGVKAEKSKRIFDHVAANPGGFVHSVTSVHYEARPAGYVGDLPTDARANASAASN